MGNIGIWQARRKKRQPRKGKLEMKIEKLSVRMGVLLFVGTAGLIHSQDAPRKPVIDPEADNLLHQLSDHNKQVKSAITFSWN